MKTLLLVSLLAGAGGCVVSTRTTMPINGDVLIYMNGKLADLLRVAALIPAGFALGFMLIIIKNLLSVKHDTRDMLIRPGVVFCMAYFLCIVYIGIDLASRVSHFNSGVDYPYITWRTPCSFVLFLLSDVSLYMLMRRLGVAMARAKRQQACVRFTVTDIRPGTQPDVDLTTGSSVMPGTGESVS